MTYLESCQTSMIELFLQKTIFTKSSIVDVRQGFKYSSKYGCGKLFIWVWCTSLPGNEIFHYGFLHFLYVVRSAPNPILCSYIYYLESQLFTNVLLNSCCKNFPKFTGEYLWWGGGSHCVKKYPNAEFFLVHIFFIP